MFVSGYAGDIFREWEIKFASIICPRETQSARGFCRGLSGGGGPHYAMTPVINDYNAQTSIL